MAQHITVSGSPSQTSFLRPFTKQAPSFDSWYCACAPFHACVTAVIRPFLAGVLSAFSGFVSPIGDIFTDSCITKQRSFSVLTGRMLMRQRLRQGRSVPRRDELDDGPQVEGHAPAPARGLSLQHGADGQLARVQRKRSALQHARHQLQPPRDT